MGREEWIVLLTIVFWGLKQIICGHLERGFACILIFFAIFLLNNDRISLFTPVTVENMANDVRPHFHWPSQWPLFDEYSFNLLQENSYA